MVHGKWCELCWGAVVASTRACAIHGSGQVRIPVFAYLLGCWVLVATPKQGLCTPPALRESLWSLHHQACHLPRQRLPLSRLVSVALARRCRRADTAPGTHYKRACRWPHRQRACTPGSTLSSRVALQSSEQRIMSDITHSSRSSASVCSCSEAQTVEGSDKLLPAQQFSLETLHAQFSHTTQETEQ